METPSENAASAETLPQETASLGGSQQMEQERILKELRDSKSESRSADLAKASEPEAKRMEPPDESERESKLRERHGENYLSKEERDRLKKSGWQRTGSDTDRHEEQAKRIQAQIAALQGELKGAAVTQENQEELQKKTIQLYALEQRMEESVSEYQAAIKKELAEKYGSDEKFRDRHDRYEAAVTEGLDKGRDFFNAVLASPYRVSLLEDFYGWLDVPGNFQRFAASTHEQRLQALRMQEANIKLGHRMPPAAESLSPIERQLGRKIDRPGVEPGTGMGAGGKAGIDPNNQQEILDHFKKQGLFNRR
jgi:hypothetical protein